MHAARASAASTAERGRGQRHRHRIEREPALREAKACASAVATPRPPSPVDSRATSAPQTPDQRQHQHARRAPLQSGAASAWNAILGVAEAIAAPGQREEQGNRPAARRQRAAQRSGSVDTVSPIAPAGPRRAAIATCAAPIEAARPASELARPARRAVAVRGQQRSSAPRLQRGGIRPSDRVAKSSAITPSPICAADPGVRRVPPACIPIIPCTCRHQPVRPVYAASSASSP